MATPRLKELYKSEIVSKLESALAVLGHNVIRYLDQDFFFGIKIPVIGSSGDTGGCHNICDGDVGESLLIHQLCQGSCDF